jgi:adenylosuccinate lyase
MINRYSRDEMAKIWSDENKYKIWLDIEANALEAMEILGEIPKGTAEHVFNNGKFNVEEILEIEKTTKHDVIAFLTNLADSIGDSSKYVHKGMTSSDVLDTCLSKQLDMAAEILLEDLDKLLEVLKDQSFKHKNTICLGRSHGIHAEPTTFGLKMARFYAEFKRGKERLCQAREEIAVCAISGAVGTHATINPFIQKHVAKKMKLKEEDVSTQIIPRDRHAFFFSVLGVIASSIENIAIEIRHLQRTEVLEVEEFFSKGQKGSSAMPHKRNPVLSENLTGLSRIVRSAVNPMLENVALWHERDISHSSVERMLAPDATVTLDFALNRLINLVENLLIYPQNMKKNLDQLNGLIFSQRVLLCLIDEAGVSREEAYKIVQRNAMKVWQDNASFFDLLLSDEDVKKVISKQKLNSIFDINFYTKNIDHIFQKVFS